MLDDIAFNIWSQQLGLTADAIALVKKIRTSDPARRAGGFGKSVSGRYPSRKMGVVIQFDSHKVELCFIHEYEHKKEVLEYYEQPNTIKLSYEAKNGRRLGVLHTPDFFIMQPDAAGWEESKTEEHLLELASKNPNRYHLDTDGQWRCPPGEEYAEQFGLYYRVRSSKEINWTYQRNIEFIDDYYRAKSPIVKTEARELVLAAVTKEPGIRLGELFRQIGGTVSRDDIFMLIAHGGLYVDLSAALLVEPDAVCVFADRVTATGYKNLIQTAQIRATIPKVVNVSVGSVIQWDGHGWEIVNVGETSIGLVRGYEAFTELPIAAFEKLVQAGRITGGAIRASNSIHPEAMKRFAESNREEYEKANHRAEIVRAYSRGNSFLSVEHVPERTLRYWRAKYRQAEEAYGIGYVGLLMPNRRGNSKDKLPLETKTLLDEYIKNDYETIKQKPKREVFAAYKLACERRGIIAASYKTFWKAIKSRPINEQTKKRQGRKAAYATEEFYWELDLTIPRHGDRPFHIAHIDHTQLDLELVCSLTGQNLGRPWATFLTDAYSRRLLAIYVTFDPPSYRSCMMILRTCVQRFGRLPQIVVVDGGLEFSSTYFDTLLAAYEYGKKTRPSSKSRFGSVCERLFGTSNTQFIHNLQGNTQIMRNVRQVTKSIDPKSHAIWTLEATYYYLCEWGYEVYDTNEHCALGQTPRDTFAHGLITTGERKHLLIPYDNDFRMLTLPMGRKETAKVQPGRGVKINTRYYWSDTFRNPKVEGTRVPTRFDPFNVGLGYAFVLGQWVECYSEAYRVFRNHTEREVMIASTELRGRQKRYYKQESITTAKLAHFLESVEAEEILLRQRAADREQRSILSLVDSGINCRQSATGISTITPILDTDPNIPCSPPLVSSPKADTPKIYGGF